MHLARGAAGGQRARGGQDDHGHDGDKGGKRWARLTSTQHEKWPVFDEKLIEVTGDAIILRGGIYRTGGLVLNPAGSNCITLMS